MLDQTAIKVSNANAALLRRRQNAVPTGVAHATDRYAARAQNAEIWDVEGTRYIDFAGGIGVLNVGHRHPKVMAAVAAQMQHFTHTAFQVMAYEGYVELAERLNAVAPIVGPAKTALFTTGAEAVENAVKIARAATRRSGVIAFSGGFHGRTLFTTALTGKVMPYKQQFGPMAAQVYHLPFPVAHHGISVEDSLRALQHLFRSDIGPLEVAAIIIEPVQGEGGFYVAPAALLLALREICDTHGILLIADEVQSGFARTGRLFAIEHSGVKPDLITIAKSLAGGLPLSGVIGRAEVMDSVDPGGLGGTYGGNPLSCAAALAVLDVIDEESLLHRAQHLGARLVAAIEGFRRQPALAPIGDVRGLGAMVAFEIMSAEDHNRPDPEATKKICAAALVNGLVLLSCGVFGNVIRILMPLTISDPLLEEGLARLASALSAEEL